MTASKLFKVDDLALLVPLAGFCPQQGGEVLRSLRASVRELPPPEHCRLTLTAVQAAYTIGFAKVAANAAGLEALPGQLQIDEVLGAHPHTWPRAFLEHWLVVGALNAIVAVNARLAELFSAVQPWSNRVDYCLRPELTVAAEVA